MTNSNGTIPVKPKVLIPEKVSPDGLILLNKSLEVHERKGLSAEQLLEIIPGEYAHSISRVPTDISARNACKSRLSIIP